MTQRVRRHDKRIIYLLAAVFVATFSFVFLNGRFGNTEDDVDAASLANFDAGNIISDYVMGNYNSMSESDIQNFLTSKNSCDDTDYDYYRALSNGSSYEWHWADGHFICLSEEKFGDGETIGSGDTAAHIIYQAAQDYKINPQVLIILLQKETGLITDPIPNNGDYRKATGYGCPDTAACSSKYYGFKNQVRHAAALFRDVLDGGWTNYPLGNNYIQYNPNSGCGGSTVNIQNLATSALYRYTPYQPNSGALEAGYGTAYCGSYGNRNFYLYFNDWFGSTTGVNWTQMEIPRIMVVTKSTQIIDPAKHDTKQWVEAGESYYFDSKTIITWSGTKQTCLHRKDDGEQCILLSRLEDFSVQNNATKLYETTEYNIKQYTCAISLESLETLCGDIEFSADDKISAKYIANINGKELLIEDENTNYGILAKRADRIFDFDEIETTTYKVLRDTQKYQAGTTTNVQTLKQNDYHFIKISEKITIDGKEYYRTEHDASAGNLYVIPADDLSDNIFSDFKSPRNLMVTTTISSVNVVTKEKCQSIYQRGSIQNYSKKINYGGTLYYQSTDEIGSYCVTPSSNLKETPYFSNKNSDALKKFANFLDPRKLKLRESIYEVNIQDGTTLTSILEISKNIQLKYPSTGKSTSDRRTIRKITHLALFLPIY